MGYTLLEKLSDSVYTQIYRGYRNSDQLPIICKVLSNPHPSPKEIAQFQREYYLTRRLNSHAGFIRAYDLLAYKNTWVMVLEDIGGKALSELLKIYKNDIHQFLRFAIRLTEIVGELHQCNIIHKDINPSNIIINEKTGQIQLIDFEIATELSRETQEICSLDTLEGNLCYISPEQTGRMNRSVDYRTDLYSLGITWYEVLTGRLPFEAHDAMEWVHCHIAKIPPAPIDINPNIPYVLSAIIMRLLEKTAENRYQSTYGLQVDLHKCLVQQEETGHIENFPLASKDASSYFQITEKLYGREMEIDVLLDSFDRVSQGGAELMLVAGYSGIGKSALVHEVHKPFVKKRGYFVSGKFDQFKRNIPYDSIFQAFRGLVRQLLTESDNQLILWREKLSSYLGPNGQVLIDVVPEIEQIIGTQPPVPELSPSATRNRFNLVLLNFISAFSATQPLVIFLDDLQWADTATLQLLELLMGDEKQHHLFIIGAYRDNEVDEFHPLMLTLKNIEQLGIQVNTITLKPLALPHVMQLIADSLKSTPIEVIPVAQLCWEKTLGNPFFLNQLLHMFHHSGAIFFDKVNGTWQWHLEQMQQATISDNVIDLMVKKIKQQPPESQVVLELAACIGNQFDLKTLSIVYQKSLTETAEALWQALREELILPLGNIYKFVNKISDYNNIVTKELDSVEIDNQIGALIPLYRFIHDRVQQAAYSLIDETQKNATHLQVGRLLLENSSTVELEERLFDIVNHLNRAEKLIEQANERKRLAELNLMAGKTAKSSAAYEPALSYLQHGLSLLPADTWTTDYPLSLNLYVEATEAAFLNGDYEQMNQWAALVLQHSHDLLDKVRIYEIQIQAFMAQNQPLKAIELALDVLRLLGVFFPKKTSMLHILRDIYRARFILLGKNIEQLRHLPITTKPHDLAVMRIMNRIYSAAYIADTKQMILTSIKLMSFSVQRGNSPISAFAYASYGLILCGVIGDISTGHRFGKLALQVLEDFNANELKCRTYFMVYNFVWHWEAALEETLAPLLEAYQVGVDTGELEFAGYSIFMYCNYSFFAGHTLEELTQETAKYVMAIDQIQQQTPLYYNQIVLQTILNLRGANEQQPWLLVGEAYDETKMLPIHTHANDITALAFLYVHKIMLCYWFERYDLVVNYAEQVNPMGIASMFHSTVFHFYSALARLALMQTGDKKAQQQYARALRENVRNIKTWAKHAPMNNAHRYALIQAEQARLDKNIPKTIQYYKQAMTLAKKNHFRHEEGLICERYAHFWQQQADSNISATYIKEAFYLYQLWGATAKLEVLKLRYPELSLGIAAKSLTISQRTRTINTSNNNTRRGSASDSLDLSTIIKASRSLSEEIQLARLLKKLISIVMENAGAQHGMLLLEKNNQWYIEAHSNTQNLVIMPSHPVKKTSEQEISVLPVPLIQQVIYTRQPKIIDNAQEDNLYNTDRYIQAQQVKSILCSPVIHQGKLIAIIYLENNLSNAVFTADRLELVQLIASQLAISIENARLYANLEEKVEQRTEKLAQANQSIQELNQRLEEENQKLAVARQVALQATESKSAFLANMSHEIRTPMNAIVGITNILDETPLNEEQKEYLNIIRTSSNTLLTLINDILDFSKIEANKLILEKREFDLRVCVEDALNLISSRVAEKQLNIVYRMDANVAQSIIGDSIRLKQILINLLGNAVKFTEQGEIQLYIQAKTEDNQQQIQFTVKDTGIGIAPNHLGHLFQSFTQADASTTRKYGGTGLGLAISKRLCELMQGQIWVESELGIGSAFHFTIQATIAQNQPQQVLYDKHPRLQGKTVLLTHLLPSNQVLLQEQSQCWGMHVITDVTTALQTPIDLALIDITLGDIPEAVLKLTCPVIALTNLYVKTQRQSLAFACLTKPIRPRRLLDVYLQALEAVSPTPMNQTQPVAIPEPVTLPTPAVTNISSLNILLVDDNAVNRKVGLLQLKKLGYQADTATDGLDALTVLRAKNYDIVLMDMQMPKMDGLEATRIIIETWQESERPWIIAMTANAMKEDREKCFAAGMQDYITKPVLAADLQLAIERAKEARQQLMMNAS
ncbi:putative ATPase [Beggiatoa alba B18LD]|uniref:Sensory/regulatory protein RpfC n=1 Tax=Beggiatoa alba B18LD TaxID=395493 RepID=I3CEX3_9GAMM|nr:AAA family ATPase [Beggiatoa alba]EIJ42166.1 putative ATPase [Beggiatoa alba B18LD]